MPKRNHQKKKTSASEEEKKLCAFCNKTAERKCVGCLKVHYCNKEHQKLDWKNHGNNCSVLKLVEESSGQKYYVARRDIKVDELVYQEKEPLVLGPTSHGVDVPKCLSCYCELTEKIANPCKICGWPLCADCKTHGPECEIIGKFFKTKVSVDKYQEIDINYSSIIGLRALALRTRNPGAYLKLIKLRDGVIKGSVQEIAINMSNDSYKMLNAMAPEEDTSILSELAKITPVLICHSHNITIKKGRLVAVYENVSYFKHNCLPNCTKYISDIGGISISAITPISKGQIVTICYVEPRLPAMKRRSFLTLNHIACKCERCDDPSEFGTMYNAVKCIEKDCDGYMLPPTFISDPDIRIYYVCGKCTLEIDSKFIEYMERESELKLRKLQSRQCCDVCEFKKVLEELRYQFHESHVNVIDVKAELAIIIGAEDALERTSNELLNEKIQYCRETASIFHLIIPSERVDRGIILFHLYLGLQEYSARMALLSEPVKALSAWEDSKKALAECYALLHYAAVHDNEAAELAARAKQLLMNSAKWRRN